MLVQRRIEPQNIEDPQEFSVGFCPNFRNDSLYAVLGLGLLDLSCRRKGREEENFFYFRVREFCKKLKNLGKYSKKTKIFLKLLHVLKNVADGKEAAGYLYYYVKLNENEEIESIIEIVRFIILLGECGSSVKEVVERRYVLNEYYVGRVVQVFCDFFFVGVFVYKDLECLKILPCQGEAWPVIFLSQGRMGLYSLLFPIEFTDSTKQNLFNYPFWYSNKENPAIDLRLKVLPEDSKVDLGQTNINGIKQIEEPNIIINKVVSETEPANKFISEFNYPDVNSALNPNNSITENFNKNEIIENKLNEPDKILKINIEYKPTEEQYIPDDYLGLTLHKISKGFNIIK